jgi:lipopolysaccharide export system ATP-binding protein
MEDLLTTEELSKSYRGRRVVNAVSMLVARGEVVGLLGPNGAGKTTSFNMVVGLVHPDSGRVTLAGHDITREPMYQRARFGISYLPQEASIFRKLTVEQNILAILQTLSLPRRRQRERLDELIENLGLDAVRKSFGFQLSGGERRRVEIARSLVISPSFLLLDEPFSGIDPKQVIELQRIIGELRLSGIGILVTDHNVRETLSVTDRAYIIHNGSVFRSGSPGELENDPEVRRVYLGENFQFSRSWASEKQATLSE